LKPGAKPKPEKKVIRLSASGSLTVHGKHATFELQATSGKLRGLFAFTDLAGGVRLQATKASWFSIDPKTGKATLRGTALNLVTGRRVAFTVVVSAAAHPGSLTVSIGRYHASGRVTSGHVSLEA
jgi:hypothetical protein